MGKIETKIAGSPLPNVHYPSQEELRAMTQRLINNPSWAFNPHFQKPFLFPAFGTAEWLALTIWSRFAGDVSKIDCPDKLKSADWQYLWQYIYAENSVPSSSPVWIPDTTNYSMKHPEGWVQTLLDADRFWRIEINAWAMEMVEKEFRETNDDGLHLSHYAEWPEFTAQCEWFCRRFHAYQQARYRWHEHLLEKHCERALGKEVLIKAKNYIPKAVGHIPETAAEARASLIGWLSKQRGFGKSFLVNEFRRQIRAKKSALSSNEKKSFHAEREHPSGHRYRAAPDEMGWLILTWPICNFYKWRWTDIGKAVIKKFRFGDRDFLPTSKKRLRKALLDNFDKEGSMPMENALALFYKHLCNPTPKEKEMHDDWERDVHIQRGASAFKELAKLAIGDELAKQIEPRPSGRGTNKKPPLWDFAQQISA